MFETDLVMIKEAELTRKTRICLCSSTAVHFYALKNWDSVVLHRHTRTHNAERETGGTENRD